MSNMLRVLLVDDEPFILQGLQYIVDWKSEGYEIVAALTNGKEALDYLKENAVDLILSDIQMPVMTGLELLETVQKKNISNARFAILTGYDDFSYAQRALKFNTIDYILKPVQKEDILALLRNVSKLEIEKNKNEVQQKKFEDAYLARNILALIKGKFGEDNLEYVKSHLQLGGDVRYIDIAVVEKVDEDDDTDLRQTQHQLFTACREAQKFSDSNFIFDVSYDENNYDVGFIFCENMATRLDMTEYEYLVQMMDKIKTIVRKDLRITCGKRVSEISEIAKSYSCCCMLNSIIGFRKEKTIYIYEEEVQVGKDVGYICKESMDSVILSIQNNDKIGIKENVEKLYKEMGQMDEKMNVVNLNTNYLLFQLIHIATQQDDKVNQEEVIRYLSEHSFEQSFSRGSSQHMINFANEFADYLSSLRGNVSRGLIANIDKEIEEHFEENITLKSLGDQYFINSSYLGQLFRKAHDMSFKDYLTKVRVEHAVTLLVTTDEKVNNIAEMVGYADCDYFIRKFIELKGCTPSKYRRNNSNR